MTVLLVHTKLSRVITYSDRPDIFQDRPLKLVTLTPKVDYLVKCLQSADQVQRRFQGLLSQSVVTSIKIELWSSISALKTSCFSLPLNLNFLDSVSGLFSCRMHYKLKCAFKI